MPHSLSAKKRQRQNEKRYLQNKAVRSRVRSEMKRFRASVAAGDLDGARAQFPAIQKRLDQAVAKRVFHRNTAARHKQRLQALLAKASASAGAPA